MPFYPTDQSRRRDGLKKLIRLGKLMCSTVAAFAALLRSRYKNVPEVLALLDAILVVCSLLPDAENAAELVSGQNEGILSDPLTAPGINPGAPPPPDPDDPGTT